MFNKKFLEKVITILCIINWCSITLFSINIVETVFERFPLVIKLIYFNCCISVIVLIIDSFNKKAIENIHMIKK